MVSVKNLVLLATSVVAIAVPRNDGASVVLSYLKKVDTDTKNLAAANQAYNGSAASAGPIEKGVTQLEQDLNATVAATQRSNPFSNSDAQRIIDFINNPLIPDTMFAVKTTENNRALIEKNGLKQTVHDFFVELEHLFRMFSQAALKKTSAQKDPALDRATKKMISLYAGGAQYFS